jgi:hypothetical protein
MNDTIESYCDIEDRECAMDAGINDDTELRQMLDRDELTELQTSLLAVDLMVGDVPVSVYESLHNRCDRIGKNAGCVLALFQKKQESTLSSVDYGKQ